MGEEARHSCLKLHLPDQTEPIFVKATLFNTHFHLDITDGLEAWTCQGSTFFKKKKLINYLRNCKFTLTWFQFNVDDDDLASEEEVRERAAQWDQPVSEYIELAEKYLGFQQPGSVYKFTDAGLGHRRVCFVILYRNGFCLSSDALLLLFSIGSDLY